MRKLLYLFIMIFVLISNKFYSMAEITCVARYQYQVYHPPVAPSYYQGSRIGQVPIAGTGQDGYYENKWSNTYNLRVKFYSGYELNQRLNTYGDDNLIFAVVFWDNGGSTIIAIEDWETELKTMTENEIRYTLDGDKITQMSGYDDEGRYWEFYL